MASQAQTRLQLLKDLQSAVKSYTAAERKRLQNEVSVMKAILKGRTGGAGIQSLNTQVASAAAKSSLDAYLNPPD